jgi:outer membrane lipoprotein-sorting protein
MLRILLGTIFLTICYFLPSQTLALTKDEVAKKIMQKHEAPAIAYKADIKTKVFVQGQSIIDSGYILYSPPDCYKIEMFKGKTMVSILGDTNWIHMPDGSVTRKIGVPAVPGLDGTNTSSGSPDIGIMLKGTDFSIIEEKPGKHVVIEFEMRLPTGEKTKAQATFDTGEWLVRNMKIFNGIAGTVEVGYTYKKFDKYTMVSEIATVMGSMGFVKIFYENYRKTAKVPRSKFKQF